MMKLLRNVFLVCFILPTLAMAGEDIVQDPDAEKETKPEIGFELPIYGERLPDESVFVAPYELDPANETAELVVSQYSGDGGCCTDIVVLTNSLDGWRVVDFSWGLEEGTSAKDFIIDIDGDGIYEIVADKIYSIEDGEVSSKECKIFEMIGPEKQIKRCMGS